MIGLADFHADPGGEFRRDSQPRTEDFQNERIAGTDQFHAAAKAYAERLEPLRVLIVGLDAAHDRADARRQRVEADERNGLFNSCHSDDKISFPADKSTQPREVIDAIAGRKFVEMRRRLGQSLRVNLPRPMFLLLAAALVAGCGPTPPLAAPKAPTLEDFLPKHAQPKLRTMKLYVGPETVDAEIALSRDEIMTGIMYRTNILETDAMLFDLQVPQRASFWMYHCPESISAAYITPEGVIAEVHHLEQNDTNAVLSATENIRFVLETKEGWFARHQIVPGMVIVSENGPLAATFSRRQ